MEFVQIKCGVRRKSSSFWWCKRYSAIWSSSWEHLKSVFAVNLGYRCTGLSCTLGSLPPGGEAASGQLAPRGWRYPGVSCPPPWAACPPGVKLPLGSLPPGGEDTQAWAACPPPQENLTELNAERFYFFKIKIFIVETRENWSLHVCAYASFSW